MPLDPEAIQARSEALIGETLGGRYRLDAVLGIGAMGAVFRAYHTGLEREVAVKLLHRDLMASEEMRARFSREAAAISKLDHPNCVRVSDFGSDDDFQYLVMEFLRGTTLADELEQPLAPLRAVELTDQVLAGLEHAHGHGLVHRDVKPDNIFLVRDEGGGARPKLLDFGIVKLQEQDGQRQLTQVGMIFGTPHFMSPEQAMGSDVDARTDLYALGIVLYNMLCGELPFDSDDPVKVLRAQINEDPPPLSEQIPSELREVVARLLAKKPEERYEDATATRGALAAVRQLLDPAPSAAPVAVSEAVTPVAPMAVAAGAGAVSGANSIPPGSTGSAAATGAALTGHGAAQAPSLVVPSSASASWWPPSKSARWLGVGVGAVALVAIIAVSAGGDGDATPEPTEPAGSAAARSGLGALLGGGAEDGGAKDEPAKADDEDLKVDDGGEPADDASGSTPNFDVADALIEAGEFKGARISLETMLDRFPEEAGLHWRMARVLTEIGGSDNRRAALRSYSAAIAANAALLDDEGFFEGMQALMGDSKLRIEAVDLAIDHLGTRADQELIGWLNVQSRPLPYPSRQRIIEHLQGHDRGDEVNHPLQRAHDLWQARDTQEPCQAFGKALDEAGRAPESYLVGTLRRVSVPVVEGPDAKKQPCPDMAEKLEQVRAKHDLMFAGIDPAVPKAYRRRKKG